MAAPHVGYFWRFYLSFVLSWWIICQWSAQAKTPLMSHVLCLLESCQVSPQIFRPVRKVRTSLPPSQYSRLSEERPGSPFGTFVYLVSHCVWDLLSTCEARSVPVRGEAASWNRADGSSELRERNFTLPHLYNKCTPLPKRNNERAAFA